MNEPIMKSASYGILTDSSRWPFENQINASIRSGGIFEYCRVHPELRHNTDIDLSITDFRYSMQ